MSAKRARGPRLPLVPLLLPAGYRLLSEFIRALAAERSRLKWQASYDAENEADDAFLQLSSDAPPSEIAQLHRAADDAEAAGRRERDLIVRMTCAIVAQMLRDGRLPVWLLTGDLGLHEVPSHFWAIPEGARLLETGCDIVRIGRHRWWPWQPLTGLLIVRDDAMAVLTLGFAPPSHPAGAGTQTAPAPSAAETLPYQELQARVIDKLGLAEGGRVKVNTIREELRCVWAGDMGRNPKDLSASMVNTLATALRSIEQKRGGPLPRRPRNG